MSQSKTISSALISVFSKNGLEPIVKKLKAQGVTIYSTGGTQKFINDLGIEVVAVEAVTDYLSSNPEISRATRVRCGLQALAGKLASQR